MYFRVTCGGSASTFRFWRGHLTLGLCLGFSRFSESWTDPLFKEGLQVFCSAMSAEHICHGKATKTCSSSKVSLTSSVCSMLVSDFSSVQQNLVAMKSMWGKGEKGGKWSGNLWCTWNSTTTQCLRTWARVKIGACSGDTAVRNCWQTQVLPHF